MQFRDLRTQYINLKNQIDHVVNNILHETNYISGPQVEQLESELAEYAGVKNCITCGNGTDALSLALMAWNIMPEENGVSKPKPAVYVPDFTFFASAEAVSLAGAVPVFVDIREETFNISPDSLEQAIKKTLEDGLLVPKAIIAVDLFGQPAEYKQIREIADRHHLLILEDGAQGFGGGIDGRRACSFGDISTTSFFPAKPLGCYGDGGAIFTDNDEWAEIIRSLRVHGKGQDKYDNIRIGLNSRLDTLQAGILQVKLKAFQQYELERVNSIASRYTQSLQKIVKTPTILDGYESSWAQYTILLRDSTERDSLQKYLSDKEIPSMVYYKKTMSMQKAFENTYMKNPDVAIAQSVCRRVLSLPLSPYLEISDQDRIISCVIDFLADRR